MTFTVTDALSSASEFGIFDYVLPFLLIFAVVFAILEKTKILSSGEHGDGNRGILAIIAVAVALLSLQFSIVTTFFATIFPRFGVGISIFLVIMIFVGFFHPGEENKGKNGWIAWALAAGVVVWAFASWGSWTGSAGIGGWFSEYIWALIVLGIIIGLIIFVSKKKKGDSEGK